MDKMMFVIVILVGIFSIFCAIMNFDWFIEHKKAKFFLKLFGRTGTRIFYIIIGIFLIALSLLALISGQTWT